MLMNSNNCMILRIPGGTIPVNIMSILGVKKMDTSFIIPYYFLIERGIIIVKLVLWRVKCLPL